MRQRPRVDSDDEMPPPRARPSEHNRRGDRDGPSERGDRDGSWEENRRGDRDGPGERSRRGAGDAPWEQNRRGDRDGPRKRPFPEADSEEGGSRKVKREFGWERDARPAEAANKAQPKYEPSGLLDAEANTKNGVVIKFNVPFEARSATKKWKLVCFKAAAEEGQCIRIDYQKWFLIGKDVRVVDIPMVHPTISKQHAALCHQITESGEVRPFLWDLGSTNGTFVNGAKLEPMEPRELRERDILRFAKSTREYVVLHDDLAECIEVPLEDVLSQKLEAERREKARTARKGRYW